MRRQKGIIINGEWLGNNVTINGLFNVLCAIAPFVMQDFIHIINKIENLNEIVEINKFSFPNNNTVEIEFGNSQFSGLASLYYRLYQGYPVLINRDLEIYDVNNYKICMQNNNNEICNDSDNNINKFESKDINKISDKDITTDMQSEENNVSETELEENTLEEVTLENEVHNNISKNDIIDLANEIINRNAAHSMETVVINLQTPKMNNESNKNQENITQESLEENITGENTQETLNSDNADIYKEDGNDNEDNTETAIKSTIKNNILINMQNINENVSIEQNVEQDCLIDNSNVNLATNQVQNEIFNNEIGASNNNETDDIENEIYDSFFADLYNQPICKPETLSQEKKENIAMNAMLNEVVSLREELTRLKEIKPIWEKDNTVNEISDEMADFRIMKNGVAINASIVDEETFVAGNTMYKWGDMLYLEE